MKTGSKIIWIAVLVLLAILLAVGVPFFIKARDASQRNACWNNIWSMSCPLECCIPMAKSLADGDEMNPKDHLEYIKGGVIPICPSGGRYRICYVVGGPLPVCIIHGPTPDDVTQTGDISWEWDSLDPVSRRLCQAALFSCDHGAGGWPTSLPVTGSHQFSSFISNLDTSVYSITYEPFDTQRGFGRILCHERHDKTGDTGTNRDIEVTFSDKTIELNGRTVYSAAQRPVPHGSH